MWRLAIFCLCFFSHTAFAARIISLAPNLTEIVFALGLGDSLVGVTEQCDFPFEAKRKTKVGSFVSPSLETILTLKPSVVLATEGNSAAVIQKLEGSGIAILRFDPQTALNVPIEILKLSKALGREAQGKIIANDLSAAVANLQKLPRSSDTALMVVNVDPVYVASANTWMGNLLEIAGLKNSMTGSIKYPLISKEFLLAKPPQHLFVTEFALSSAPLQNPDALGLASKAVFGAQANQKALANVKIHVVPKDILERPGPRLAEGARWLAAELKK